MRRTVTVDLGERTYDIVISPDGDLSGAMPESDDASRVLMVTDSNVGPLHGPWGASLLSSRGWHVETQTFEAGEASKSLSTMAVLYDRAAELELERRSLVAALGGGVVGDMTGFLAATYMRGIRYVQIPTSLLAMVDSSVGGKTGINLSAGKNLVGAFYQPDVVVVNLSVLETLPPREFASGMAEVVKYGVIYDADFFAFLEQNTARILDRDAGILGDVVARCCEIKAAVVAGDEREGGLRAILNFGHTLGHAVEAVLGYGDWLHGEAVAAGMVYAARVSERERGFPPAETERLMRLLRAMRLPVRWTAPGAVLRWDSVRDAMSRDKKTRGSVPRFVLIDRIGSSAYGCVVGEDVLSDVFAGV